MNEEKKIDNAETANENMACNLVLAEVKNTDSENKIIVIGGGMAGKTSLLLHTLKEKYGGNVEVVTVDEAEQRGFKPEQMELTNRYKITAPPIMELTQLDYKSGKESRRERRAKERNANKKHKW